MLLICLSFADRSYSLSAESGHQGETQAIARQQSTTLGTLYVLEALKKMNYSNRKVIGSAIGYLKKTQNSDGGWGLRKGDKSDGKITAKMIIGLWPYKDEYALENTLRKANDYISSLKKS